MTMNTYNENLQNTVISTLAGIDLAQQELLSEVTVAETTLYHAQGAELTARDKADATIDLLGDWENINNEALRNDNRMFNLLSTATDAGKVVATSITNTATAASNAQIASNAISLLASDIGAALNVATASLFNTDVYSRIENANSFINNVANDARAIARNAMNASAWTSEVISTEVLTLAKGSKTKVGGVLKSTQAEVNRFAALMIAEAAAITTASTLERQAEGNLDDAEHAVSAITDTYANAMRQLNMNLSITVLSGYEITASFSGLPSPLPAFSAPPASSVVIPDAAPHYYLTLIQTQNASIFSTDQAMQLFQQATNPGGPDSGFLTVHPGVPNAASGPSMLLTVDAFGNAVTPGQSYVAYIFTELSSPYKQYTNNFADLLSAPSQAFTPATTLPSVLSATIAPGEQPDTMTVQFQAVPLALSAEEAAAAAEADAALADKASADATAAVANAQSAASTIVSTASAAAVAVQAAPTATITASNDAAAQWAASEAAETAAQSASTSGQVKVASTAASIAASVASSAAALAQGMLSSTASAPAASATDGAAKGKGKAGGDNGDAASQAKATGAPAVNGADLMAAVAAASTAAALSETAGDGASVLVTLCGQARNPVWTDDAFALAKALAVARSANAAATAAATAAALAAQNAAVVASASAKGSSSASAANSAATTSAAAAQTSDAAQSAAAAANAAVTAASENLSPVELQQAQEILKTTSAVAAAVPVPGSSGTQAGSAPAIAPALASAIISAAAGAAKAAALAVTAVTVTNGAFTPTRPAEAANSEPTPQDMATVQAAVSAVAAAAQGCASDAATNATNAASASDSAQQSAATAAAASATAATTAAASAAAADAAAQTVASTKVAAAAALANSDVASKQADSAIAQMKLASAAAQSSAALAAQIAAGPPVSEGTILAAEAVAAATYEWRCILLQVGGMPDLKLKVYGDSDPMPQIYFNQSLAEQVSAANYVLARDSMLDIPPDTPTGFRNPVWKADITSATTDNFGNVLIPGSQYYLYILAAAAEDQAGQGGQTAFTDNLSKCLGPYTIFPPAMSSAPAH